MIEYGHKGVGWFVLIVYLELPTAASAVRQLADWAQRQPLSAMLVNARLAAGKEDARRSLPPS